MRFAALDPGDARRPEHVALVDRVAGYLDRRLGQHPYFAAGKRSAVCRLLWGDIHHASPAERIDMGQSSLRHPRQSMR